MSRKHNPSYAQRRADAREDHLWKQDLSLHTQADAVRAKIPEAVRSVTEQYSRELEKLYAEHTRDRRALWTEFANAPLTQFAGGVHVSLATVMGPPDCQGDGTTVARY